MMDLMLVVMFIILIFNCNGLWWCVGGLNRVTGALDGVVIIVADWVGLRPTESECEYKINVN